MGARVCVNDVDGDVAEEAAGAVRAAGGEAVAAAGSVADPADCRHLVAAAGEAGVIGLTKSLAREWAPFRVNVNAVAPGFVATRLTAPREGGESGLGIPAETREAIVRRIPIGRAGTPEDVAAVVGFLCSPG